MKLAFTDEAWDDYLYWQKVDKKMAQKVNELIKHIKREPFNGIGKPEPLKYELAGFWSRRMNDEHRLVYNIDNDTILIVACRYQY